MRCICLKGYEGNPYFLRGCQDIDECKIGKPDICKSNMVCRNSIGGHHCIPPKKSNLHMVILDCSAGIGTGLGGLFLLIGAGWLGMKIRKRMKKKERNFKRNGGLLLQEKLKTFDGGADRCKIYNSKEIDKATDHFNVNRIIGQGGQGTVYKGMLADGRIIAVKKSKVVAKVKIEEFIHEIAILSQINHRNVVKLLGCCLETYVPLLVYEFIPNGTLFQYIHDQHEEIPLTWESRLRIAIEVAEALSYLHFAASSPIYHRDIKSTNILLDDKYKAKIADFGTSISIAIDQTHITTKVQGTFGYLDPEYFHSSIFTAKSDVYSFGVVLAELLTGERPINSTWAEEGKNLAIIFVTSMEENHLFDILDARVREMAMAKEEEVLAVANVAKNCLNPIGKYRPTIKEVAKELARIRGSTKGSNAQQNYEEVEYERTESTEPRDVASSSTRRSE
ncbi:putative Kinase [Melia azedarach]|nr:putative Kinase [Melia azedarach]